MADLTGHMPTPRIGVLPTGHLHYWDQFPRLKGSCDQLLGALCENLGRIGDVVAVELVDNMDRARAAANQFRAQGVDILIVFPCTYSTGVLIVPCAQALDVPIRLLNAHLDTSYDYATADETAYLHHEGVCCIPEFAGALRNLGQRFRVVTGHFGEQRLWDELGADCRGAAAARQFRALHFGVICVTYTHMADMPTDEHRLLRATGKLLVRPEVEEIEEAFGRVTDAQREDMCAQFRELYDVDESVTNEHMRFSAQVAVAFDEIVADKYDLSAFGYYWWGKKDLVTQLRSQSGLAVSRLAALGRPGVTEGDVKTAMAMKALDLLGAGGMFVEFFAMDFDENFLLMGHDGPANVNVASGRPRLTHLAVHHGKSGHGLGIDFRMREGPVTLVNLTELDAGDTFKLIYTVAEVIPGPILQIGNPNCRVRVSLPIHEFMDAWCQEGPSHHLALGVGDRGRDIEAFAEAMGFRCARIGGRA